MAMSFISSGSVADVLAKAKVSTDTKAIGFFNARVLNSDGHPIGHTIPCLSKALTAYNFTQEPERITDAGTKELNNQLLELLRNIQEECVFFRGVIINPKNGEELPIQISYRPNKPKETVSPVSCWIKK